MLSYRHSFHAGNPADVIKHLVLAEVLAYLTKKDKPFDYIDTHSGAGFFELGGQDAQKNQEFMAGIAKLWDYQGKVAAISRYRDLIESVNRNGQLEYYPGSPKVAEQFLRRQDNGWFFELHPRDLALLQQNTNHKRSLRVNGSDGFKGLLGLVPPASRRACVLMDPPYEIKSDYEKAVASIVKAHKKFPSGVYMIWYPVVERERIDAMEASLVDSGIRNIQLFELATRADTEEKGMTASGLMVVNPPYTLMQTMAEVLPELVSLLAEDQGAGYRCLQLVDE